MTIKHKWFHEKWAPGVIIKNKLSRTKNIKI